MTSFQLAFQLMLRLVDLNTRHVFNIVRALDLDWKHFENVHSEVSSPYKVDERSTTRQEWTTFVDGAYLIQQSPAGRLQVNLQSPETRYKADGDFHHRLPKYDYEYLATKGIVPVFANGGAVALVCGPVRWGDILLIGEDFDLVLRACSDATTFVVVGAAYTPKLFKPGTNTNACGCWEAGGGEYDLQRIRICLEITRQEAFADHLVQNSIPMDSSGRDKVVSYLLHHATGSVLRGSFVQDVTTDDWQDEEVMGPRHPMCSAHLSSELHRVLRNPLWVAILSGSNRFVWTCKPPRSRTASTSSSEWVTEEE